MVRQPLPIDLTMEPASFFRPYIKIILNPIEENQEALTALIDTAATRWSESLSRFKFMVKHIKEESNTVADEAKGHVLENLNTFIGVIVDPLSL